MKIDGRKIKTLKLPEGMCICRQSGCPIPFGLCHCGCGQKTRIARQGRSDRGEISGHPQRYIPGHGNTGKRRILPRTDGVCMCGDPNCVIPYGKCHCGCGEATEICKITDRHRGWINGQPHKFKVGHNRLTPARKTLPPNQCICGKKFCAIPYGLCHCGCGGKTTIPKKSRTSDGSIKGIPKQWIRFHSTVTSEIGIRNQKQLSQLRNVRKGYIGVGTTKNISKPWRAGIGTGSSRKELGTFYTEEDAARAYDKAAMDQYGEYAILNFPEEYPEWVNAQIIRKGKDIEIVKRLLETNATSTSIGEEIGCSPSTICVMWRNYTTKEQRIKAKTRKVADAIRGVPNNRLAEWIKKNGAPNKGKPMNPELKERLRIINTGRKPSMEQRIAQSARMQGITVEEWKEFSSGHWAKIKNTPEYKNWRKSVYERDDWTCQHCSERGGRLHAHHIRPKSLYPELMFDISNGLTLCVSCHHRAHTKMEEARNGFVICRLRKNLKPKGEENERSRMVLNRQ